MGVPAQKEKSEYSDIYTYDTKKVLPENGSGSSSALVFFIRGPVAVLMLGLRSLSRMLSTALDCK